MTSPPWRPSRRALAELAEKYAALVGLRRERATTGATATRERLSALARRFPGALSELDTMPLEELDARLAALASALAGEGEVAPWMGYSSAYHAVLREAARLRREARGGSDAPGLAEEAGLHAELPLDEADVRALTGPGRARAVDAALAVVARHCGADEREVERALLPRRRPR